MHSSALIARVAQEVVAHGSQANQVVGPAVEVEMSVSKVICDFWCQNSIESIVFSEIFDNGYVWYFRGCSTLEQQQQHFLEKVENNKCGTYTGAKGLYKGKKVELCVCSSSYCNQ